MTETSDCIPTKPPKVPFDVRASSQSLVQPDLNVDASCGNFPIKFTPINPIGFKQIFGTFASSIICICMGK